MESELAIAHEVQALLFPADLSGLPSLEVHGVCKPARTVSGDYYDFIPLSAQRLMLAVGDISGKGISAALLMATVHAFVRAYSLEPEKSAGFAGVGRRQLAKQMWSQLAATEMASDCLSPAFLMATLNYQLYPQHAAGEIRDHVPRLLRRVVARADLLQRRTPAAAGVERRRQGAAVGDVGTVVGLFDGMTYGESTVGHAAGRYLRRL